MDIIYTIVLYEIALFGFTKKLHLEKKKREQSSKVKT